MTSAVRIMFESVLVLEVDIAYRVNSLSIVISYMCCYLAVSRESMN